MIKGQFLAFGLATAACSAGSAVATPAPDRDVATDEVAIGEELQFCKECPVFVRVPAPPDDMRRIKFVAKYELTWNNYLAAYDAGVCPFPLLLNRKFEEFSIDPASPVFQEFRRDYPISNLRPSDLECYMGWLQGQTEGQVRLPTYSEWEWFASSGHPGRKFPWGNEEDPTREALVSEHIPDVLWQPHVNPVDNAIVSHIILGTRVGLFSPTEWGLHDLMGNVQELTADVVDSSNIDAYRRELGVPINDHPGQWRVVKGAILLFSRSDSWRDGISKTSFVSEDDNKFSFPTGVRLVLQEQ